jgi:hypothetical protein
MSLTIPKHNRSPSLLANKVDVLPCLLGKARVVDPALRTITRPVTYRLSTITHLANLAAPISVQTPQNYRFLTTPKRPKTQPSHFKNALFCSEIPLSAPCQAKNLSISSQPTDSTPHTVRPQLTESPSIFAILKLRSPEGSS